jgi:L-ribulokinase
VVAPLNRYHGYCNHVDAIMPAVLGLDFGTESVRALLLDTERGEVLGAAARSYANGVIDAVLPESGAALAPDWALQNPDDWLLSMSDATTAVLAESGFPADEVVGIGIDFTSCTVLPVTGLGEPLCRNPEFRADPHAWPKLWKHHAAQPQADRINELASRRGETWPARYGGRISSEWMLPKALEILEHAPSVYAAAERIIEGGDWVAWQLTGRLVRNSCAAGYKALWHAEEGHPSDQYLEELHPGLTDLFSSKLDAEIKPPGFKIGTLSRTWQKRMGLPDEVAVACPIIDAHAAAIGGGSSQAGDLFLIMGTSTCHLLLAKDEKNVPGVAGVVKDGIVEGFFAYEAGQAATGDCLAWLARYGVPASYSREAVKQGLSTHEYLSSLASGLGVGESGLLALDWLNGNRSTLVDADLSGLVLGIGLSTRPEEIYRALIESTAYGTRIIIDAFEEAGLPIANVRAGGTMAGNELIAQIYADVLGREFLVVDSPEVSARGAAILGAAGAGLYGSVAEAASALGTRIARTFVPRSDAEATYDSLYAEYQRLYDYFGRGENPVMKTLKTVRSRANLTEDQ